MKAPYYFHLKSLDEIFLVLQIHFLQNPYFGIFFFFRNPCSLVAGKAPPPLLLPPLPPIPAAAGHHSPDRELVREIKQNKKNRTT